MCRVIDGKFTKYRVVFIVEDHRSIVASVTASGDFHFEV
jgi:hypothetical protein